MFSESARKKEIEKAKDFRGKYYVKYVYLDDSGDCRPYYVWDEETYETIEELGRWVARRVEHDSDFVFVEIKKLVDLDDEEYGRYTVAIANEKVSIQEKRKVAEERALKEKEEQKKKREKDQYELYLRLKEKFE